MNIKKNFFAPWAKGLGATRRAAMLLLVMMLTTATAWAWDGQGTSSNPYLIASPGDLTQLATNVNNGTDYNGKYFKQTANITLTSAWTPIGTESHPFKGHYDGGNFTINGLTVSGSYDYAGLFGYTSNTSSHVLKNIIVENCNIDISGVANSNAGGIVGYAADDTQIQNCRVSGTVKAASCAGGIAGKMWTVTSGHVSKIIQCFTDVTVAATQKGKLLGNSTAPGIDNSVFNSKYSYYHNDGSGVTAFGNVADITYSVPVYTISGVPSGVTIDKESTVTYGGKGYYTAGTELTLTVDDANKILRTFSVSGATYSVAANKKSATVTLGSSDATVTATLLTVGGSWGTNVTWAMSDTDSDGTYETLTISGSGAITSSPWATDFAATITRVNISSADLTISGNPFSTLGGSAVIVVPTPAYAIGYISAAFASKLRVVLRSYLFSVTSEGGTPAYAITGETDLRNLAAVINSNTSDYDVIGTGQGMTFRQTANIAFSNQAFTPIGAQGTYGKNFKGTYDGGSYTISGLTVSTDKEYAGLFGRVIGATIKNVVLVSPTVTSNYNDKDFFAEVGALVGFMQDGSRVENCLVITPTVSASNSKKDVGAIVGFLHAESDRLTNTLFYSTTDYAFAGSYEAGSITNSGRARKVTLGSGVSIESPAASSLEYGFVYEAATYYREGVTLTLTGVSPTGYSPVYSANGTALGGNTYSVNSTDGDVTLTLSGNVPITYTVHFNGNGNTGGSMSNQDFTYGTAQSLTANAFTRALTVTYHYNGATGGNGQTSAIVTATFSGWAETASGEKVYNDQQSVNNLTTTNNGTFNLYAKWTDGSVTLPTPDKTGYTFVGWYSDAGLTAKVGDAGDSYTPSADIPLYAKWGIPYIDAGGNTQVCANFTVLTNGTDVSDLDGGWYVVMEDVSYSSQFKCSSGDIHLILCDGAKMTVTETDAVAMCLDYHNSLTIYAQSTDISMGQLVATSSNGGVIFAGDGDVTICGGQVDCNELHAYDNVTIYDGRITVSNDKEDGRGIWSRNNVTIHGGQVSATGAASGIYADNSITLGLRNATDYIYASSYFTGSNNTDEANISVKTGQTLTDGTSIYRGSLGQELSGRTFHLYTGHLDLADHFSQDGDTYTIHTATGWDEFCNVLGENDKGFFSGKTVKLGNDISVTRMAGSSGKEFTGTFNGNGKTLTVNYANTDIKTITAPFSYVDGATIQNLIVGGSISGINGRAAGIIGATGTNKSYITNCVSNVDISGDYNTAGFSIGGNVEIEGCVFNGKINGTDRSGGFIGYSNSAQVIKNSLFAPQYGSYISGGTFYYNGGGDVAPVNSYYTRALGDAQGTKPIVTASKPSNIGDVGTAYNVSGITAYGNGLLYGNEYYCGNSQFGEIALAYSGSSLTATIGASTATVSIPEDVTVSSVTYERTFTASKPSTVMLPFSLGDGQKLTGGKLYKFTGVTKNETAGKWEATMTETATLQANTPYLLMPDNELVDGKVTFDLNNSTVTLNTNGGGNRVTAEQGSHWTFKGTYEYMKWTTDTSDPDYNAERKAEIGRAYGFAGVAKTGIEVGDFVKVASGAKIRPMGCYLLWSDTPNASRAAARGAATEELPQSITVRLVSADGEVTGIGEIDTKTGEMTFDSEAWYTLNGVRLSGKPTKKGLYIMNGKKVVVK